MLFPTDIIFACTHTELEDEMDQKAIEGFKIRLSRKFQQVDVAKRAKQVRDLGALVLGLNERINSITANIHDKVSCYHYMYKTCASMRVERTTFFIFLFPGGKCFRDA